jgi:hypothetical protein
MITHHAVIAQIVINVEHVDAIKLKKGSGEVSFYQKQKNQYKKLEINLFEKGNDRFKSSGKWKTYKEIIQPEEEVIAINNIKSYSSKSLLKYLSNYQFVTFNDDKGDSTYYSLQLFNVYKTLVREMDTLKQQYRPDAEGEWPRYYFALKSFIILQFRANKFMLLYGDKDGYFIPGKKKDHIFVKNYPFETASIVRQKQDNQWKEKDEIIQQVIDSYLFSDADYDVETTDDDKRLLVDIYGNKLLSDNYDSIAKFEYFIFASKGANIQVYNLFLQPLFKNVRSYTLNNNYPQIVNMIIGDSLIKGDFRGNTNPSKRYPYVYRTNYDHGYRSSLSGPYIEENKNKTGYFLFSSFETGRENNYLTQKDSILLPDGVGPEDVNIIRYSHGDEIAPQRGAPELLIAKRGKLYGLFMVPGPNALVDLTIRKENSSNHGDTVYTGVLVQCKEILPIRFDSISRFNRDGIERLLLYKDGLIGIYPLQKEVRYKTIEKPNEQKILRFQLPDGKFGWLNLWTRKELLDQ